MNQEPLEPHDSTDAVAQLLARRRQAAGRVRPDFTGSRSAHHYEQLADSEEGIQPQPLRRSVVRWRPPALPKVLIGSVVAISAVIIGFTLSTPEDSQSVSLTQQVLETQPPSTGDVMRSTSEPDPATAERGNSAQLVQSGEQPLLVHVTGAVNSPGVFELPAGARAIEAVEKAGGVTSEADTSTVNLAAPLTDGTQLYVPVIGEQARPEQPVSAKVPETRNTNSAAVGQKININTATSEELQTLPSVGPSTAQKIIDWRQANGSFQLPEELDQVSGIGPATLERLLPLVTV
ncbi:MULTISPECIES: helix-hairpin-helix domain-containing protein [unclassified Rothia (in: high G+C Gram-positive bacteria)]|uniref:helix-hairpin-helix domain-containing protein n=1 Tax=unclassified Rothia (in: high G+C Gram-positive bacteria) TaxID=2689056 RepID=UPI00195BC549|nr:MULTISPECIES: helix-hairpin-helix domain-containing protein [unclassified Rothia (in: high G+C Gram-positive bacteria)]MBM7050515.1 helix-hairpin-helix domain-containing protein [Rothia sp. ZJ1223]QRZ60710.1 helix-hairpin-helix domain-containing protein [Rothia sp. ZJ932]